MPISTVWRGYILNNLLKEAALPDRSGIMELALYTGAIDPEGPTTNEVSSTSTGYARLELETTDWHDAAAINGTTIQSHNNVDFEFPVATGNWGTVSGIAILNTDDSDVVTVIAHHTLTSNVTVNAGSQIVFRENSVTLGLT